jgi:single-strand DNA-binding protein
MFNRVILVGNLTRDLELRYSPSGLAIGKTGIATNRNYKTQNGESKDEVMFIDITFFGRTAEIANQYLKKGSKVLVEGRLILEQWTDQSGGKRSKHSITVESMKMLGGRDDHQGGYSAGGSSYDQMDSGYGQESSNSYNQPQQQSYNNSNQQQQQPKNSIPEIDIDEDEIPF